MLNELENSRMEAKKLREKMKEYEQILADQDEKFQRHESESKQTLIDIHKKWATFSKETINLSKNFYLLAEKLVSSKAQKITLDGYLKQLDEYEHFLNMSIEDLKMLEDRRNMAELDESDTRRPTAIEDSYKVNCTQLDVKRIKIAFREVTDSNYLCALLQALRWRITRVIHAITRREAVVQMVSNDLLENKLAHILLEKKGSKVSVRRQN